MENIIKENAGSTQESEIPNSKLATVFTILIKKEYNIFCIKHLNQ